MGVDACMKTKLHPNPHRNGDQGTLTTDIKPEVGTRILRFILGNSGDYLALHPEETYDWCITDPPYNVGMGYDTYDDNCPTEHYIIQMGHIFQPLLKQVKKGMLISPGKKRWFEFCGIVFGPSIIDQGELDIFERRTGHITTGKLAYAARWEPVLAVRLDPQVKFTVDGFDTPQENYVGERDSHPAAKPIEFYRGCAKVADFEKYPPKKVIDPFGGRGTAQILLDYGVQEVVMIDLSPNYLRLGIQYAKKKLSQEELFKKLPTTIIVQDVEGKEIEL